MTHSAIRIGNQTSRFVPDQIPFAFAIQHKFTAFEWFSDRSDAGGFEIECSQKMRTELRQRSIDYGIRLSVHAPYSADATTAAGVREIRQSIDFAADVGAHIVNFHLNPETLPNQFADSVFPILEATRGSEVVLTLENTPETSPEHFNQVFELLSTATVIGGSIGMCLDSGHANLFAGTRNDYLKFVDRLGDHVPILHWHAHENWGDCDSHLTLFTGPAGRDPTGLRMLVDRFLRRGYVGSIILEQWPSPPQLLVDAVQGLGRLLADCQQSISEDARLFDQNPGTA